jgi:alkylhydroperoxidase family enzyme
LVELAPDDRGIAVARHAYPEIETLPPALADEIKARIGPDRGNVWRMLCWTPDTAETFVAYSESVRHRNDIPPKIRELVILRVGHLCGAPYEVHHHRRIAREVGLGDAEIAAAAEGPEAEGLDDGQRFALTMADELCGEKRLSQATFDKAVAAYGIRTVADMVLLVGFYTMACMFLNSFAIDIEPPA